MARQAPGAALGDRALQGGPGRPAPSPPPTAGGGGAGLGPRFPLRLRPPRSWGESSGLGHSGRLLSARGSGSPASLAELRGPGRQARKPLPPGAPELESRDAQPITETLKTPGAPSASRAPARPSWPRHCLWLCFAAAVGAAEVATVHPGRDEEPPSPREWAFPPPREP